jgi:hypothetical protein
MTDRGPWKTVEERGDVGEAPLLEPRPEPQQWMTQFNEHLLLTVQAVHRLNQALLDRLR